MVQAHAKNVVVPEKLNVNHATATADVINVMEKVTGVAMNAAVLEIAADVKALEM